MFDKFQIEEMRNRGCELLTPDKSKKGYICPICQSGSGKHGTGMTMRKGRFTCWANDCFKSADIFDIVGRLHSLTTFNEQAAYVAAHLGIVENAAVPMQKKRKEQRGAPAAYAPSSPAGSGNTEPSEETDYTEQYRQWSDALPDVLENGTYRGISFDTLREFQIGYTPAWKHPKCLNNANVPVSPRIIIPTGVNSYLARDIRQPSELTDNQKKYAKQKVGPVELFNGAVLRKKHDRPIFIVEGEFDAMSLAEAGALAVGIGGTSMIGKLAAQIKDGARNAFIVWLDNDEAGDTAAAKLIKTLKKAGVPCCKAAGVPGVKDPNEALLQDRDAFAAAVRTAEEDGWQHAQTVWEQEREAFRRDSAVYALDGFDGRLRQLADYTSTGFPSLDRLLDGGLYPGYHVLGAVSSLGKTTLVLQIAAHIAAQGRDVLVFSLEMARDELIIKSLSCETLKLELQEKGEAGQALTSRQILNQHRLTDEGARALLERAKEKYRSYAKHIYIHEAIGDIGTQDIRERTKHHMSVMDAAPVVIIDYVQILAPADVRATDKQNTDRMVVDLKRISRDLNIPIFGISSFNRANYLAPVNIASFKESGSIEYTGDTLFGLQYAGFDYQEEESEKARLIRIRDLMEKNEGRARSGKPVKIQVKVLKQRSGIRGSAVLDFYPKFNCYEDLQNPLYDHSKEEEEEQQEYDRKWKEIISRES